MTEKAEVRAEAERLRATFEGCGAEVFEADVLQPAGALLDLYGEDIRARAFVTQDPIQGEMMLRPDFTLALVQSHIAQGRQGARYTYSGEVFRQQETHPARAAEYIQVGYEVIGAPRAASDADVFSRFHQLLAPLGLKSAMGDIGLLRAAVAGLQTSPARKAALMRHLWRPRRFKALLTRFSRVPRAVPELGSAVEIGLRTISEVKERLSRLQEDAGVPALSAEEIGLIEALLAVRGSVEDTLPQLRDLQVDMPAIEPALASFEERLDAMNDADVAAGSLQFEASYGRTTLEYYDGFVFGFFDENRPDLPPVATGGRYDALTRAIGGGDLPAVGGVIRPGLLCAYRETGT